MNAILGDLSDPPVKRIWKKQTQLRASKKKLLTELTETELKGEQPVIYLDVGLVVHFNGTNHNKILTIPLLGEHGKWPAFV